MARIKDDDGNPVSEGDTIVFTYGIPPVFVYAPIKRIGGHLYAMTTGHDPNRCKLSELRGFVGNFYLHEKKP